MSYCSIFPVSIISTSQQLNLLLSSAYRLRPSFSASLIKARCTLVFSCLSLHLKLTLISQTQGLVAQLTCGIQVYLKDLHSQPFQESGATQVCLHGYRHSSTLVLHGIMTQSSGQVSKTGKKCLTELVGLTHCRYFKPQTENISLPCYSTWGPSVIPVFLSTFYLGLS